MVKKWYEKRLKEMKYNPIGMWGAWVGVALLYLSSLLFGMDYYNLYYLTIWQSWLHLPSITIQVPILTITFGFLIGWGIHSLVRAIRK